MDFGLGLVLSFTDNATAGINNAVNSLNQLTKVAESASSSLDQMASLSALSVVSGQIGNSFTTMGTTILSTLGQIVGKVNETGQTMMYADMQLSKLYENSGKTGQEVLDQIQQYAKTSIFEFEDLIPVVTSLKSVGIEAFDSIATSTGSANQTLMDYAADLASFAPQMRNAYGTGIQAAMGAIREYIAEGNARSLKAGAGIDITGILGEEKGKTIQERSQQVADLIDKLGMVGMTANMANTPMTKLSNMGDTLFQFMSMVSQSGVYDKFNVLITKLADYVSAIPEDELESMANTVGSALSSIISPLEWVVDRVLSLADSIRSLVANNPGLAKIVVMGTAIVGVLLVVAGVALKVTSALSGLSLMLLTMGKTFSSIGGLIKTGALKILGTLLPLTATIGLLYLAWKSDFAGIRTNVTYFVTNLATSFRTARQAVNGSVEDLISTLSELRSKGDFFSNLTIGIMKVMMLFKALADGWSDYSLSEDNFLKAKELGILPLIEAILDLKYRFDFFKQGFIDGWKEIGENVKNALSGFLDSIDGTVLESLVDDFTVFIEKLASGDTQAWYDFGKSFADFTANALALWVVLKAIGGFAKIITPIVSLFTSISKLKLGGKLGGFAKEIGAVIGVFKGKEGVGFISKFIEAMRGVDSLKAGKNVMNISNAFKIVFGTVGTVVAGITTLISGIAMAVTGFVKQLTGGFSAFWEVIKWIGIALGVVGAIILGAAAWPAIIVGAIIGAVTFLIVAIKDNWAKISQFFSTIATWVYANVIQPIVNFFMTYLFPIISKVVEIVMKIIEIVVTLVRVFVQGLVSFFQWAWEGIYNRFAGIAEWFGGLFASAFEFIKKFFAPVVDWLGGIWENIKSFFSDVGQIVASAIKDVISSAVNFVLGNAVKLINGFISALNFAIDVLNAVPGVSITKLTKLEIPKLAQGGIVDKPTLSVVGEAGREAVMPLENNTGWITSLAHMMIAEMQSLRPTNSSNISSVTNTGDTNRYMTTNNSNSQVYQGDTDNSIVFNQGAIQVTVQNASEEEATKFAKKILEYIKRQKELDKMMNYA